MLLPLEILEASDHQLPQAEAVLQHILCLCSFSTVSVPNGLSTTISRPDAAQSSSELRLGPLQGKPTVRMATDAAREAVREGRFGPYPNKLSSAIVLAAVKGWVLAMLGFACAWLRFPGFAGL